MLNTGLLCDFIFSETKHKYEVVNIWNFKMCTKQESFQSTYYVFSLTVAISHLLLCNNCRIKQKGS